MLKDARGSGHSAVVSPASRAPVPQHPTFLQDPAHPTVTWPHFSRPCSLALPCGSFPGNWALHGAQTNLGFSGRPPLGGPWTFLSFNCSDCRIIPTVALCSGGPSSAPSSGGSCLLGSCLLGSSRLLSHASPRQRVLWDGREPFTKTLQGTAACSLLCSPRNYLVNRNLCIHIVFPPGSSFD